MFKLCFTEKSLDARFDFILVFYQDTDANLASSTLVSVGENPNDALGIVISYSVRVALNCGALGGELVADLPFKLVHPAPSEYFMAYDFISFIENCDQIGSSSTQWVYYDIGLHFINKKTVLDLNIVFLIKSSTGQCWHCNVVQIFPI